MWGVSSFGRALPWHGRGEEFEPPTLHHLQGYRPCFFIVFVLL